MFLNQVFEFSMVLNEKKFQEVLSMSHVNAEEWDEEKEEYLDDSMAEKGIMIRYRDSQYKKKVFLIYNLQWKQVDETSKVNKIVGNLEKCIREYFSYKYKLNDFKLSGMLLANDINVGQQETVNEYLKVFRRIGKVKNFTVADLENLEKKQYFYLRGNSNSIMFLAYNMGAVIQEYHKEMGTGGKKAKSAVKETKGILRLEVRLDKPKAIRMYAASDDLAECMKELLRESQNIFLDVLRQVIPFGDYYKKDKAFEIIQERVKDKMLRRKMLRLAALIPEKKSLYLAQKTMSCNRDMDKIMNGFVKINLSPVTISKRQDMKYMKNIYDFLFDE